MQSSGYTKDHPTADTEDMRVPRRLWPTEGVTGCSWRTSWPAAAERGADRWQNEEVDGCIRM